MGKHLDLTKEVDYDELTDEQVMERVAAARRAQRQGAHWHGTLQHDHPGEIGHAHQLRHPTAHLPATADEPQRRPPAVETVRVFAAQEAVIGCIPSEWLVDDYHADIAQRVVQALRQALSGPHGREVAEGLGMVGVSYRIVQVADSAAVEDHLFRLPREGEG